MWLLVPKNAQGLIAIGYYIQKRKKIGQKQMAKNKVCVNCKKPLAIRQRKYCSKKCQAYYDYQNNPKTHKRVLESSKKRYEAIKNTKKFRDYRRNYFRAWVEKNREHFNAMMRIANIKRSKKIYAERTSKGLCVNCGGKRDSDLISCQACRDRKMVYYYNQRAKLKQNGK